MENKKETYVLIYPMGTSYSCDLFSKREDAEKKLNAEADCTLKYLDEAGVLTFGIIEGKNEAEIEKELVEKKYEEDGEYYGADYATILMDMLTYIEDVPPFSREDEDDDYAPSDFLNI